MKKSSVSSTQAAVTSDESPVRAPDARLSAERENDPLTGIDWQNAAAILASPCPMSSWFSSQRTRVLMAIALQLDIASMKLMSAMTKAAGNNAVIALHSSAGTPTPGSPAGMLPTTRPPRAANPMNSLTTIRMATVISTPGSRGANFRKRDEHRDRRQRRSRATTRAAYPSA